MSEWRCDDCGWTKTGDYCVCPHQPTDTDCHCVELTLMSAPDEPWRGRCEDAPCCGCCDAGSAVMPG